MPREFFTQVAAPAAGLDKQNPPTLIDDRRAPDVQNVRFKGGVVYKRPGYSFVSSVAVSSGPMLAADFRQESGTVTAILAVTAGIYKWTGSAWSAIKTGLTGSATGRHSATIMNDAWLYTNGLDRVQKWTGSGNTSDLTGGSDYQTGNWHICRAIAAFADRVLLLGTNETGTAYPFRVRWSELGKIDEYNEAQGGGHFDMAEDPSGLECGVLLGDNCVLYCGGSIWLAQYVGGVTFEGTVVPYRFVKAIPDTGTRAPRTVKSLGFEHIFMGEDDIYAFNGSGLTPIGEPIREELFAGVSRDNRPTAFAVLNRDEYLYRLFVPYASTNINRCYVYNYKEGTWAKDEYPVNLTCGEALELGDIDTIDELPTDAIDAMPADPIDWLGGYAGKRYTFLADANGNTYQDTGSDANDRATAIDGWWESKDFVLDDRYIDEYKRVRNIYYEAKGDAVTLQYSTDAGNTWSAAFTETLTDDYVRYKADVDERTRAMRVRFRNNTSAERFWLRWLAFRGQVVGDR